MSPEAEALREKLWRMQHIGDRGTQAIARIIVEELRLAEPEMHVPNALAHKLLPLLELAEPRE